MPPVSAHPERRRQGVDPHAAEPNEAPEPYPKYGADYWAAEAESKATQEREELQQRLHVGWYRPSAVTHRKDLVLSLGTPKRDGSHPGSSTDRVIHKGRVLTEEEVEPLIPIPQPLYLQTLSPKQREIQVEGQNR